MSSQVYNTPRKAHEALLRSFGRFSFATQGELPGGLAAIDHIAHTPDLIGGSVGIWSGETASQIRLSDHVGVWCDFRAG